MGRRRRGSGQNGRASLICLIAVLGAAAAQNPQPNPVTRPNIWDPLGEKTTTRPRTAGLAPGQVAVRITPGRVIGRRIEIKNLFWTANRDMRDQQPQDRGPFDRNPLPPKNNVSVYAFQGIPYALPPEERRRFKPPQKLNRYPGPDATIEALRFREACVQDVEARPTLWPHIPYEYETAEDCLFLNVYTPQVARASEISYPVVVFFHGGGFQFGSANDWPGAVLATKGLVVVTANYRLGAFGFASLGEPGTGNYGLMDQRLVLEWVQDHVYEFGGNPARVTLIGHGAGAASAGIHMLSPGSRQLFHGVAAMSGAEVAYESVITKPGLAFNNTMKLGRQVGCTQTTAKDVWACILTRSPQDFVQGVAGRSMIVEYNRFSFLPVVDGIVIPGPPIALLKSKEVISAVPYLTGVNEADGTETLLSDRTLRQIDWKVDYPYIQDRILDFLIKRNYTTNRQALQEAVSYLYTYWPEKWNDQRARLEFIRFASEAYYVAPVSQSAELHSTSGSFTWMYVNNYNFSRSAPNPQAEFLPRWMGACHECDLMLLFGFPWMPREELPLHYRPAAWTETDRNASELFMAHFAAFAKKGQPNLPLETLWENYAPNGRHYYLNFNFTSRTQLLNEQLLGPRGGGPQLQPGVIRSGGVLDSKGRLVLRDGRQLERDYKYERVAFWNNYIHRLANYFTTTLSPTVASIRRQLIGYKAVTGGSIVLLAIAVIVAGVLAYKLFDAKGRPARLVGMDYATDAASPVPIVDYSQSYAEPPSYTQDWPGAPNKRIGTHV